MPEIAVLIPCYNEEATIAAVVRDFSAVLPGAQVIVYDNNSTDASVLKAREAGARVGHEKQQGKGHVVRRMFADVEADVYVLVVGDGTFDAGAAPRLVTTLLDGQYDMITAARMASSDAAYRRGHVFGNRFISGMVAFLFGYSCRDVLSGYRVFSRRFVKSFPALARGFEIETEINVHALQLRLPMHEIETAYRERPEGSFSKLSTVRDGFRIVLTILHLLKEEKPLAFFGGIAMLLTLFSILLGIPVVEEFFATGQVPRLLASGLILDSLTRARLEAKRLHYLLYLAPRK
jgi:glycosyltransferase involved in cell wall biosynthesis